MSIIPFIEARFFDPNETLFELEARLTQHMSQVRGKRLLPDVITPHDDVLDDIDNMDKSPKEIIGINTDDVIRIRRGVILPESDAPAASSRPPSSGH